MHQQRKPPLKRHSSYLSHAELSPLHDRVSSRPEKYRTASENDGLDERGGYVGVDEKSSRRRSMNTLHFDALQSAVSKLSRMDDYDMEELGYGFFSDVFKVTHKQSGKIMVLKRNKSTNTKMNILREVQLMNRLAHPNILKFMGVCVHEGQLHALTEFLNGGDLDQLVQQKNTYLSWSVRIRLALDVAKGLAYLHSMGIFHRDLTAKNCLVRITTTYKQKKRYSAVLADLGLAEKIPTKPADQARLRVVGTPYCMAPEVLCDKPYDEKSDFFSFGLIICQLIIRTPTDPEKLPRSNDFGLQKDVFGALVKKGVGSPEAVKGNLPLSIPPWGFQQLAYDCCEVDPLKRPGVKEIVRRLEQTASEEKGSRKEKKELLLSQNASDMGKRHSFPLTVLPSATSLLHQPCELPAEEPNGENRNKEKKSSSSTNAAGSTGLGVCSRLSRSFSDVSKELISHAASIIASSQGSLAADSQDANDDMSAVLHSFNEAFVNPFEALKNSELQEAKLFDLPSSDVLKMAFDLPAPKFRSPRHLRRPHLAPDRPRSLLFTPTPSGSPPSSGGTLSPAVSIFEPAKDEARFLTPLEGVDPESYPKSLSPKRSLTSCDTPDGISPRARRKQALVRSVAFSPRGKRLVSWWHSHSDLSDWRSLATVLCIMTEKMGDLKRSISDPDLSSRDSGSMLALAHKAPTCSGSPRSSIITFEKGSPRISASAKPPSGVRLHPYPSYITLPRKKKSRCPSSDAHRRHRSKTSDAVFQDDSALDILPEEAPNSRLPAFSPCRDSLEGSAVLEREINNNVERPVVKANFVGLKSGESRPMCPACSGLAQEADALSLSTSSTSSGTSSTELRMSLQSGIVCSNRRKTAGEISSRESSPPETKDFSHRPFSDSSKVDHTYTVSTSCDRDSGYNEDPFTTDASCVSQTAVDHCEASPDPAFVRNRLTDCTGRVTPTCKVGDGADSSVKLIGESH